MLFALIMSIGMLLIVFGMFYSIYKLFNIFTNGAKSFSKSNNKDNYYNDYRYNDNNSYWNAPKYYLDTVAPLNERDPQRAFSQNDIQHAKQAAGYQCEHIDEYGYRCSNRDELHADHHYPHSRGGATVCNPNIPLDPFNNNLVILCKEHNMSKSNHHPSEYDTYMINYMRGF